MEPVAAFFDMDKTIIWENSGLSSARYAFQQGLIPVQGLITGAWKMLLYRLTLLKIEQWYDNLVANIAGLSVQDMERFSRAWFDDLVSKTIYQEALELIEQHRSAGHTLVLISNAMSFITEPMAEHLNFPHVISTRVVIEEGRITGRIVKPLCQGSGKRDYALTWAHEHGIDMRRSYFYTDSIYDLELMLCVGHPVAVNPDIRLRLAARRHNWPVRVFRKTPASIPATCITPPSNPTPD